MPLLDEFDQLLLEVPKDLIDFLFDPIQRSQGYSH